MLGTIKREQYDRGDVVHLVAVHSEDAIQTAILVSQLASALKAGDNNLAKQ